MEILEYIQAWGVVLVAAFVMTQLPRYFPGTELIAYSIAVILFVAMIAVTIQLFKGE